MLLDTFSPSAKTLEVTIHPTPYTFAPMKPCCAPKNMEIMKDAIAIL